jgi:hypothetical protein
MQRSARGHIDSHAARTEPDSGYGEGKREVTTKHKKVCELEVGDNVVLANGEVVAITNISRGFYPGSKLIHWRGGWARADDSEQVEHRAGLEESESPKKAAKKNPKKW